MPAPVNGNHVIAQYERAWVFTKELHPYYACGDVVITPFFVFVSGHWGQTGDYGVIVSLAIPREDIHLIEDRSVESCETHDEMDAEAKAQMEPDAEENKEN